GPGIAGPSLAQQHPDLCPRCRRVVQTALSPLPSAQRAHHTRRHEAMKGWKFLIRRHLEDRQKAGVSNNTLEATSRWLKKFVAWCAEQGLRSPAEVMAADVERYRQFLLCVPPKNARFYTLHSVDQALRVVRQFFHWAVERRHLLFSPTAELKLPRIDTRMPQLTIEEV